MPIIKIADLPRVVLDTNVLISAAISNKGPCARILERLKQTQFVAYTNGKLSEEYGRIITERCRDGTIKDVEVASKFLREALQRLLPTRMLVSIPIVSTDPKDNHILNAAINERVDYIVTGDKGDLFGLNGDPVLGGTQVVTPAEFLAVLEARNKE